MRYESFTAARSCLIPLAGMLLAATLGGCVAETGYPPAHYGYNYPTGYPGYSYSYNYPYNYPGHDTGYYFGYYDPSPHGGSG